MNLFEQVLAIREGGQTQRCHTMQYIGPYNVAIHSYNALSLLMLLYEGSPSLALIKAVMFHDTPERWTGDVPTPAKMASFDLRVELDSLEFRVLDALGLDRIFADLTPEETSWLTAVDLIELLLWAKEQIAMGNQLMGTMYKRILKIFIEKGDTMPIAARDFAARVIDMPWKRSVGCHELIGDENESER